MMEAIGLIVASLAYLMCSHTQVITGYTLQNLADQHAEVAPPLSH